MRRSPLAAVGIAVVLAAGTACANNPSEPASFEEVRAAAQSSIDKAASVGGEWRDTRALLKSADEAAAQGQTDKAVALAERAKRQGELGYAQAVSQQTGASAGQR